MFLGRRPVVHAPEPSIGSPATFACMGLCSELEYDVPTPNAAQRAMWKLSGSALGAWVFSKTLNAMDRVVMRMTKRKSSVPRVLAGLPVVEVSMTGAKSGLRRTLPLVGVPVGDDLALIGTNFGQPTAPAWVTNLAANPDVEVHFRGKTLPARAREVSGEERSVAWEAGCRVYAGYARYARRIGDQRSVRVFLLEPA
jgi:deazaflavin-dependent oxidoreductase (nitroreductase family)